MSLSVVTYALSKKYTDETASQFGGLKGAPCKIKSIEKIDGQSIVTFEQKNDSGETRQSEMIVNDGIAAQKANHHYLINDIVLYDDALYSCIIENTDSTFNSDHQEKISSEGDAIAVELTKAEYDALSDEEKLNGTIYFVTDAEEIEEPAKLKNSITVTQAVGGVSVGKIYNVGTPLEQILRDILAPTI